MRRIITAGLLALALPAVASAQQSYQDIYNQVVPQAAGARPGGGINPYGQYAQPRPYSPPATIYAPAPPVYYAPPAPVYQAPAQGYGEPSAVNGLPRTNYVNGYYRADGTYVQPYYRSR